LLLLLLLLPLLLLHCSSLLLGIMRNAAKVRPQIQHVIQQKVLWGPLLSQRKVRTQHARCVMLSTVSTP